MKSQFEDVKSLVWPFTGPSHRLDPKKLSMEQKDWLGAKINNGDFTTVELSYRFKIGVRTLRKYALNLRKGIPNYGFGGGRPPMISKAASATLARKLRRSSYQVDEKEYQEAIIQAQRDTAIEFKKDPDMVEPLSRHALARVEKREDISAGFAEVGTNARDENELCVRNAVTFAAMNKVMSELARPPLIMNADGTLFTIYGADSRTRVRFIGKRPKNLKAKARKKGEENNLRYGVKYLCLMSAGGHMAAPVFVVADDNMKKEAISVQEIPGLNFTLGCAIGYLVFCNTRVCNHAFYEWVVKTLLLDFVKEIKKIYKFDDDDVTWFQLDGEAVQIEPYLNNTILDLLEQAKVVVGKPPASTTAITQACDVGNVFRSSKSCLKTLTDEDVPMEGPLFDALKAGIKAHEAYVNHKLKSGIEKKAITAIMRSFHALTRVVSSHTIRESFKACGVYPFSVGQILKQCKAELDETTKTVIKESLNGLAEIMKINGQLTEADLSAAGIGHTVPANKKNKNENVITKRRSVFLTNRLIVDAEVERRRQIALDKELKATKKTTRARKGPAVPKANAPATGGV